MSSIRDVVAPPTPTEKLFTLLFDTRPSITSSGSFERLIDVGPRNRIRLLTPIVPPPDCTATPGVRADNTCDRFVTAATLNVVLSMRLTDAPTSRARAEPPVAPLTVTLSSTFSATPSAKFAVASPLPLTVAVAVAAA